jgi:hypothetical protein
VSEFEQPLRQMAADESGTTGYQTFRHAIRSERPASRSRKLVWETVQIREKRPLQNIRLRRDRTVPEAAVRQVVPICLAPLHRIGCAV